MPCTLCMIGKYPKKKSAEVGLSIKCRIEARQTTLFQEVEVKVQASMPINDGSIHVQVGQNRRKTSNTHTAI